MIKYKWSKSYRINTRKSIFLRLTLDEDKPADKYLLRVLLKILLINQKENTWYPNVKLYKRMFLETTKLDCQFIKKKKIPFCCPPNKNVDRTTTATERIARYEQNQPAQTVRNK